MGWTNEQAETITGLAFTYLASTVLYSLGSALTLDAGATFDTATDLNVADAEVIVTRTATNPTEAEVRLRTSTFSPDNERMLSCSQDTDTQARYMLRGDGTMEWGPGGATARDAILARTAAGKLHLTSGVLVDAGGETGEETVSFVTETSFSVAVTFADAFPTRPVVLCNIRAIAGSTIDWHARGVSITTTGFVLFVYGPSSTWTNVPVQWAAIAT